MPRIKDRVKQTTTSTGTGAVALSGTVSGFQTFAQAFPTGTQVYYCIADGTNWETGTGTYTAGSPGSLSRDTIFDSSNSGAAVAWGVGTKDVFVTVPASAIGALNIPVVAKSAAYTVSIADVGKLIECTGTWTLSLPAAAAAQNGFTVAVVNAGTGTITIDPNGSETLNGSIVAILYSGESCFLVCNGTGWDAVGGAVPAPATTFSTTVKSSYVALSNSNLTATALSGVGQNGIEGWGVTDTGYNNVKFYAEIGIGVQAGQTFVGIANTNWSGGWVGNDGNSWGCGGDRKHHNGTNYAFGTAIGSGNRVGIACDVPAGKVWFSLNGVWQAGGDPATGANPAFADVAGTIKLAYDVRAAGDSVTLYTRQAQWQSAAPAGFVPLP